MTAASTFNIGNWSILRDRRSLKTPRSPTLNPFVLRHSSSTRLTDVKYFFDAEAALEGPVSAFVPEPSPGDVESPLPPVEGELVKNASRLTMLPGSIGPLSASDRPST